jgi:hypothetical protein
LLYGLDNNAGLLRAGEADLKKYSSDVSDHVDLDE